MTLPGSILGDFFFSVASSTNAGEDAELVTFAAAAGDLAMVPEGSGLLGGDFSGSSSSIFFCSSFELVFGTPWIRGLDVSAYDRHLIKLVRMHNWLDWTG